MEQIFKQINRFQDQDFVIGREFRFVLEPVQKETGMVEKSDPDVFMEMGKDYRIQVKRYMTKPSTSTFDFQSRWNNDIPMPFVIMRGTAIKETRGMVYMELHAEAEKTTTCMCCGRPLTNPISQIYGVGPECGGHYYLNPYNTEEELQEHIEEIRNTICNIKWTGWVIKSAIKEFKEEN
jgi:hypothetical protein